MSSTATPKAIHHKNWVLFLDHVLRNVGPVNFPERLLAIDPGHTTGFAVFENRILACAGAIDTRPRSEDKIPTMPLAMLFDAILPSQIVMESYHVYASKAAQHVNSSVPTLRLIGAIETVCQMVDLPYSFQSAAQGKSFFDDRKLVGFDLIAPQRKFSPNVHNGVSDYILNLYRDSPEWLIDLRWTLPHKLLQQNPIPASKWIEHPKDAIRHGCQFIAFDRSIRTAARVAKPRSTKYVPKPRVG